MQGKKELLSKVLYRAGLFRLLAAARRDLLVVFGWHRIVPDGPRGDHPFADDVCGPTVSELETTLAWLKAHVHVASEAELVHHVRRGGKLRGPAVLLTFDDGYADNFTFAYPVLRRLGLPAVFFVPSKRIEERELGWVDLIPWFLKRTTKRELTSHGRTFRLPLERDGAIGHLHKVMQLEPAAKTAHLLDELAEATEVEPPSRAIQSREIMTWDQVREVASNGVAIGSHTHGHRVLATLDPAAQEDEIATAKRMIEANTGRAVDTIAYPVGGYRHFDADTRRIAEAAGHLLGYSYCTGSNHLGAVAPFDVKRIGPPSSLELLAGTTILPEVFDWEATPYGDL